MSRIKDRLSLKNQVSVLAFFALFMVAILGGLSVRDNIETSKTLFEQEKLLDIKRTLSEIEQEALSARLDEVQMLSHRDPKSFDDFLSRMIRVKQLSENLLGAAKVSTSLSPEFSSSLEVALTHTLDRYEDSVRGTERIGRSIGYRADQGLRLKIEIVRDEMLLLLDGLERGNLQLEFSRIQLLERDFINTLDMGISAELMEEVRYFRILTQDSNISDRQRLELQRLVQDYENLLNQSVSSVVELELAQAENQLQFDRITPEIEKSQLKIDRALNLLQQDLVEHRQVSALQIVILFCVSFLIILAFIIVQIRDSQELVRRLKQLADRMHEVASGRFPRPYDLPHGKDEVGILSKSFLSMSSQIQTQIETIEQERRNAEVANQAKSVFLANMSHELRTPLNAILGFTQIMQYQIPYDHQHREYLKIINDSGEHLLALINDVLEMSKIESGKFTLKPVSFELDHLLEMVRGLLQTKAFEKGLALTLVRSPEVPNHLFADEGKLRQILLNLLGNGIKFTESGAVKLVIVGIPISSEYSPALHPDLTDQVTLKDSQLQHWRLTFEVTDTGPGIAPDDFNLLFEAFSQTELGQNIQEGTGLGLAISRRFVQLMGGDLTVQSQLGAGATFRFEIPVSQRVLSSSMLIETPAVPLREIVSLVPGHPAPRILVVEDQAQNRRLLQDLLGTVGFIVQEACDGEAAVEIWQTWKPDLMLMDIQMPVMNGYEAVKQIRMLERSQLQSSTEHFRDKQTWDAWASHPEHQPSQLPHAHPNLAVQGRRLKVSDQPVTKIIALTANAFDGQRQEILQAGCDDFISKPVNRTTLLELMGRHLGVQYVYANADAEPTLGQAKLLKQNIKAMSALWIEQLHQAALQGDDGAVIQLIREIPSDEAACQVMISTLTQWSESYQFEQILALTEAALPTLGSLEEGAEGKP